MLIHHINLRLKHQNLKFRAWKLTMLFWPGTLITGMRTANLNVIVLEEQAGTTLTPS